MTDELAALGMPFPLYKAPLKTLSNRLGQGTCSLCGRAHQYRFQLGIGCDVIVTCHHCASRTALDAADQKSQPCFRCGATVPFPDVDFRGTAGLATCYGCLRVGRAAITHNTEFGMVRWQDAVVGLTHGLPGLRPESLGNNRFELGPMHAGEEDWRGVRIAPEVLMELVRTPRYMTLQGDSWLYDCGQVMPYLGEWTAEDFERARPGNGISLFAELIAPDTNWENEWPLLSPDIGGCYVRRCSVCGKLRAYFDCD